MLKTSFAFLGLIMTSSAAFAVDEFALTIKDHQFSPAELTVPAGKKVKLSIVNQDATAEEFESHDLSREKVIGGNSSAVVFIGPLKAGTYHYVGEYHEDSAKGTIIAK